MLPWEGFVERLKEEVQDWLKKLSFGFDLLKFTQSHFPVLCRILVENWFGALLYFLCN